jgi:hypothetical protein
MASLRQNSLRERLLVQLLAQRRFAEERLLVQLLAQRRLAEGRPRLHLPELLEHLHQRALPLCQLPVGCSFPG